MPVQNLINSGVTVVVSAGNNNGDASLKSPARVGAAITVGATGSLTVDSCRNPQSVISYDMKGAENYSTYSNWGSIVDIHAPGTAIRSAGWCPTSGSPSNTGYRYNTGTSMAAPHVAGAAALYLQDNPTATPVQVRNALVNTATSGAISGLNSGTPNKLLKVESLNSILPTKPSSVGLSIVPPNVLLTWEDESDNEYNFFVQRSSDLSNWSLVGETFANVESFSEPIPSGGAFYYRVAAANSPASQVQTSAYVMSGPPPVLTPAAPSNVNVTPLYVPAGPGGPVWVGVTVSWADNSDNEYGFRIERRFSNSGTWQQVMMAGANTTSHGVYDTSINCYPYYYRVIAFNGDGDSDPSSTDYFYICQ